MSSLLGGRNRLLFLRERHGRRLDRVEPRAILPQDLAPGVVAQRQGEELLHRFGEGAVGARIGSVYLCRSRFSRIQLSKGRIPALSATILGVLFRRAWFVGSPWFAKRGGFAPRSFPLRPITGSIPTFTIEF